MTNTTNPNNPPPTKFGEKRELDGLVGKTFVRIEYYAASAQWSFVINGGSKLNLLSHWQILASGHVVLGSGDHGQQYGLPMPIDAAENATELLQGHKITSILTDSASADLTIKLEGSLLIRTFNDSSGYEGWDIVMPDGFWIIARGGGNIVSFPPA
jgi:hypothetical protein